MKEKRILEYWIYRNKSKLYSLKLNKLFIEVSKQISKNPLIGRKTNFENIRVKNIRSYLLFYMFDQDQIKILSVWDTRRNEKDFII